MLLQVDPKLFDLVVKELVDQLLLLLHTLHELVPAGVLSGRGWSRVRCVGVHAGVYPIRQDQVTQLKE